MKRLLYLLFLIFSYCQIYGQGVEIIDNQIIKGAYEQKSYFITGELKLEEGFSLSASSTVNGEFFAKTPNPREFVTTIKSDNPGRSNNQQFKTYGGPYAPYGSLTWINLHDGSVKGSDGPFVGSGVSANFSEPGTYIVSFRNLRSIRFEFDEDAKKLLSINQWGTGIWLSLDWGFAFCENLEILTDDTPNLNNISDLNRMFLDADKVNVNLGNWDMSNITNMSYMLSGSGLSTKNYEATLAGWTAQNVQDNVRLDASGLTYCVEDARNDLIDNHSWQIHGDVSFCSDPSTIPFVTTWKTDNLGTSGDNQITLNGYGVGHDYMIDWVNTDDPAISGTFGPFSRGEKKLTFPTVGTYQLSISGRFPRMMFHGDVDGNKLLAIEQWGDNNWFSMENAFYGCKNLKVNATDNPNLSNVENASGMFAETKDIGQGIGDWDISNIGNLADFFSNSEYSVSNYDETLIGWASQDNLMSSVTLGSAGLFYCTSEDARTTLIEDFNWNIEGDFESCTITVPFVFTWDATNYGGVRIQVSKGGFGQEPEGGYNYYVEYKEINDNTNTGFLGPFNDDTYVTLPDGRFFEISITGSFPQIMFGYLDHPLKERLLTIEQWGDSRWRSMESAFYNCSNLTLNAVDQPDLTSATNLSGMFKNTSVNQSINDWDVSTIKNMTSMFQGTPFDQELDNWNVSNVQTMSSMFASSSFNQDISGWNVGNVSNMSKMFMSSSFDQDIGSWNVSNVTDMELMFSNSYLSTENYDQTLIGWSGLSILQNNVSIGVDGLAYCNAEIERNLIQTSYSWDFDGDENYCPITIPFISTWQSDVYGTSKPKQIIIPTDGSPGYNYSVSWHEIGNPSNNGLEGPFIDNAEINFPNTGIYQISISGYFPRILFEHHIDRNKILSVDQWGDNRWISMNSAFWDCDNLVINASDAPDLSALTDMSWMFYSADNMNQNLNSWNVENVEDMSRMFAHSPFNQDISNWEVGNVTNLSGTFSNANAFNRDISQWDVGKVEDFRTMFSGANAFNQNISNWNVKSAIKMSQMFDGASSFNQNLGSWDISNASEMSRMLRNSAITTSNYDATLQGWATLDPGETQIPTGISLGATGLEYCAGESARTSLINTYSWTITGDAKNCSGARLEDVVLSEEEENAQLVVYPNPADDYLQIVDQDLIGASVSIYDLKGKVQFHESNVINTQMNIDVYHIPDGTYLLKIEKDGNVSERKIIIQH